MSDWLTSPANFFWFAIVLIISIPVVTEFWRKMRKDELDAGLKHEMIARGMSADEIERVLAARSDKPAR